ncbi:MAG: chromosome partitioning protein ParA [Bacteroidetes bacterium MedPE-SWsnd-G2]|nr:MAG: chromosome partitioning protein ParA [Bacteroidetes bacterium MedPE-SWsnd-G2]
MEDTNSKSKTLKIVLGVLVVVLLGVGFYTAKLYNEKKETEATLVREKQEVMKDLDIMAKQYDEAISENDVANENLIEARARIQELMDSLKISQNSVNSLWRYKKKYMALQEEMDALLEENDRLKTENTDLAISLDSMYIDLEERNKYTDSLLVQNTELATIVEDASSLQAVGLRGLGVIERNSGKLIPTERARRSSKIRICYTVAKNTLSQEGDKELYVQVIDPNNNVLGANEQIQFEDEILNYSVISKFNYENKNLDICEFIGKTNNEKFEPGRYVVSVYNSKHKVSSTEFILK